MGGLGTRQYTTFSKTRQFQVPACWLAESVWVSEQLLAALVHCYGRPNQHDCVMSRQRSGYLFWVCVGGFCRPYWSWLAQPMLWAVQQPVLIRWAQSLSCPFPLLVLLPLHLAARPNCPCLVVVSNLLLYLASGASFWSWDKGSVSVVSESRPSACISSSFKSSWASPALLCMMAENSWDREENQDSTAHIICSSCQK